MPQTTIFHLRVITRVGLNWIIITVKAAPKWTIAGNGGIHHKWQRQKPQAAPLDRHGQVRA